MERLYNQKGIKMRELKRAAFIAALKLELPGMVILKESGYYTDTLIIKGNSYTVEYLWENLYRINSPIIPQKVLGFKEGIEYIKQSIPK